MEITLEKIELVKDRTGVSYKEAKDALEKTEGSVVDAIILIEDSIDDPDEASESKAAAVIDSIKEIVKKGNVSKILIKKDGETVLNLPVSLGVIGTVVFPWVSIAGLVAAFGTKCSIEIIKDNGEVFNLSTKAGDALDVVKSKGGVIVDEVKDRGSDALDYAKEIGKDAWIVAKDKGLDAFETAREKAVNAISKNKNEDIINVNDFGDLDLSDVDFSELEDDDE